MPSIPDVLRVGPPSTRPSLRRRVAARLGWIIRNNLKDLLLTLDLAVRGRRVRPEPDGRRRILVVDDAVPDPLFGFGFPRMFEVVGSLARAGHLVTMYPMSSQKRDLRRMAELFAGSVRFVPGEGASGLNRLIRRDGASFDMALVSRPDPMGAFRAATERRPDGKPFTVYDMEAVTTPREAARRRLFGGAWTSREEADVLAGEMEVAADADAVVAVTRADLDLITRHLHLPGVVVSHPTRSAPSTKGFADRADLLFVGRMTGAAAHYPNVDAVSWFVREVMPRLDRSLGDAYRLHLVGSFDDETAALASDRVLVHGPVPDIDDRYGNCRLFIAPTRYAAGVPIKVIETIGRGLPVVTTPVLSLQIGGEGHGFTTDPSADAYAAACARLYADEDAWRAAREYGLSLARRCFSQASFDDALAELVRHAVADRRTAAHEPS